MLSLSLFEGLALVCLIVTLCLTYSSNEAQSPALQRIFFPCGRLNLWTAVTHKDVTVPFQLSFRNTRYSCIRRVQILHLSESNATEFVHYKHKTCIKKNPTLVKVQKY